MSIQAREIIKNPNSYYQTLPIKGKRSVYFKLICDILSLFQNTSFPSHLNCTEIINAINQNLAELSTYKDLEFNKLKNLNLKVTECKDKLGSYKLIHHKMGPLDKEDVDFCIQHCVSTFLTNIDEYQKENAANVYKKHAERYKKTTGRSPLKTISEENH